MRRWLIVNQKGGLSRTRPRWHPESWTSSLYNSEKQMFKPPGLWQPRLTELDTNVWLPLLWASRHWLSLLGFHCLLHCLWPCPRWSGSQPGSHPVTRTRRVLGWRAQEKLGCGRGLDARTLLPTGLVSSGPVWSPSPPHPPTSQWARCSGTLISKRNLK